MGSEWEGRIIFLERKVSELQAENATHKEEKALFFNEIDRLKADNAKLKEETIRLKLALRSIVSHKKLSLAMNTNWTKVAVEMANMAEKAYYNHPEE